MRADRRARIPRRVPHLSRALRAVLLSALVLVFAPWPGGQARADVPQSRFGTLTADLDNKVRAYKAMGGYLLKAQELNAPGVVAFVRKQMQAQMRDIKTDLRLIHEDCERINHPKTLEDYAERLGVLTDFRNQNIKQMVGDANKVFGMSPGASAVQTPAAEAHSAAADGVASLIDHLTGSPETGAAGTGLAVFNGVSDVVNYWKMTAPFVAAAARAQDFKAKLRKCPPPPSIKGLEITPSEEVHPFGPKASTKP